MRTISKRYRSQAGFSHVVGLAMVVAAFAVVGFIGYKLYAHPAHGNTGQAGVVGSKQSDGLDASDAPTVKTAADLDKASAVLDEVDTSAEAASDVNQLDSQLKTFAN